MVWVCVCGVYECVSVACVCVVCMCGMCGACMYVCVHGV